ncbi:MAG TPA: GNAT family N-acetyltransferase [Ktedonobacterales bacterium]|nr:GNAT family N-acetyltransferase [Ktedonobacterales bacterium]
MPVHTRPANPERDAEGIVAAYNAHVPYQQRLTVEQYLENETHFPPEGQRNVIIAVTADGNDDTIIGYIDTWHWPWRDEGVFGIEVMVAPNWQGQRIGARLYGEQLDFLRAHGATQLWVNVRDDDPTSLHFAEQRGYRIDRHIFDSTLDLATFDERPFVGAIAAAEARGIGFVTLADQGESEDAQRRLYAINRAASLDVPGADQSFMPFEHWWEMVGTASWYRADGQIAAVDTATGEWVGMAAIGVFPDRDSAHHMITGVDRRYRGRGLALALKLLSLRCARRYGVAHATTNNDSQNAPILAINRKLGYQSDPGFYRMVVGMG